MHEGHRERMYDKFLKDKSLLSEHELLELLLFYSIAQKNVNPLAHELIDRFGSLQNVLSADKNALMSVNGVGLKTATFLKFIEYLAYELPLKQNVQFKSLSLDSCKNVLTDYFKPCVKEYFLILYLNKSNKVIAQQTLSSNEYDNVTIDLRELSNSIATNKPFAALCAHNHLSGTPLPSRNDDITTQKLALLFNLQGVSFYDHIIVSGDSCFSYHYDGDLDKMKEKILRDYNGGV